MFKEWEVVYPRANVLLRCHREAKKSGVGLVTQEAAKRVAGKSEVRNKCQTKEKRSKKVAISLVLIVVVARTRIRSQC